MSKVSSSFVLWDRNNKVFIGGTPTIFSDKDEAKDFLARVALHDPSVNEADRYVDVVELSLEGLPEPAKDEPKDAPKPASESKKGVSFGQSAR